MLPPSAPVRMTPVDAKTFEAVGYADATRTLYIKFRNAPTMCFKDVPRFRLSGLLNAPRPDAYYDSFIKHQFLTSEAPNNQPH